ncbi:MAG: hypothetical protein AB7G17_03770 [Phycisphaerales bacterium]
MLWRTAIIISLVFQSLLGLTAEAIASTRTPASCGPAPACCAPSENSTSCCPSDETLTDSCACAAPAEPVPEPIKSVRVVERTTLLAPIIKSTLSWPAPRTWPAPLQGPGVPHRDAPALSRLCVWLT